MITTTHKKTDSSHLFTQKSFQRGDISVNIGFKSEAHAVGCQMADVKAPTAALAQLRVQSAGDVVSTCLSGTDYSREGK